MGVPNAPSHERMQPEELKQSLLDFGMTQGEFARLTGHALRTVSHWCTVTTPNSVATLVLLLKARPELLDVLRQIADDTEPKKKGRRA